MWYYNTVTWSPKAQPHGIVSVKAQAGANRLGGNGATAMTHEDLRPDQEQFCQLIAQGTSARKVAEVLGWPTVSRQALNKRAQKLAWRINAIRAELELAAAVQRREISARWVVSELRQIALDNKAANPAVSVKALHLLGLELGMFAQRKIVEKKDAKGLSEYSDEELQAIIDGRQPNDDHATDRSGGDSSLDERSGGNLRGFIDAFSWESAPARHHLLLVEKLEEVISGDLKRLAIFMPPGSAKSYYASIMTPAYARGRQQDWNIIQASHTQQLADFWSRRVRNIVAESRWSAAFGIGLASDRRRLIAGSWRTAPNISPPASADRLPASAPISSSSMIR